MTARDVAKGLVYFSKALGSLDLIWWDFSKLIMCFEYKRSQNELKGIKVPIHWVVEDKIVTRELCRKKSDFLCQLLPTAPEGPKNLVLIFSINLGAELVGPKSMLARLEQLLQDYKDIFLEPAGLPPNRSYNH